MIICFDHSFSNNISNDDDKSLIQLSCRTNLYQNSFFPKTIRDWNALPERAVMALSAGAFAAVLKEYTADFEY